MKCPSVPLLLLSFYANALLAAEAPLSVHVATYEDIDRFVSIDGTLEAIQRATVSSQASGQITEINFDVDDYVEKGSVLLRIADSQQRSRVAAAEASELEAQAASNAAVNEFLRIQEVYEKKLVAKTDFDRAEANLKTTKERLSAASARRRDAEAELKYSLVRAPYSGVVVQRHVELGELAKVGQPLMTGLSLRQLRATATVSQAYAHYLRAAKTVSITYRGDAGEQTVISEKLRVSPQADPVSHGFVVRVELPEAQSGAYPGMFVKLGFSAGKSAHLLLPAGAVVNRSELRAVYVVADNGNLSLRQIRTGKIWPDQRVEVLAGLEVGEQVALDPMQALVLLKERPAAAN